MGIVKTNESVAHPEGRILLRNGNIIEAFAKAEPEQIPVDTGLELDSSGVYLFKNNAIALYHRKEEIYADSRMFLAPINVGCNLAYTGTAGLNRATLGVWLEWWDALQMCRQDEKGKERLVYCFAGSPLSGKNRCKAIFPSGKSTGISFSTFKPLWSTFMQINSRYAGLGQKYQAYTFEEVLDRLGMTQEQNVKKTSLGERLRRLFGIKHQN